MRMSTRFASPRRGPSLSGLEQSSAAPSLFGFERSSAAVDGDHGAHVSRAGLDEPLGARGREPGGPGSVGGDANLGLCFDQAR